MMTPRPVGMVVESISLSLASEVSRLRYKCELQTMSRDPAKGVLRLPKERVWYVTFVVIFSAPIRRRELRYVDE